MKKDSKSEVAILRQKAEELLKRKSSKSGLLLSESEMQKMMHELEVHQIEMGMQNEELEQARLAAQVSAEKYIEFYDFAPLGYFELSSAGEIIEINHRGADMLGLEPERLKNALFGFFITDDTKPIFNLFLEKVFSSHVRENCELSLTVEGNSPLNIYISGIMTKNGKHCLMNVVDITERKRAEVALKASEAKLKEANLTKDRFFSIIAHDLKSPFNSILGFSEILKKGVEKMDIPSIREYADIIHKSSLQGYRLLDNLLNWARIQQGQMPYKPVACNIKEVAHEVIGLLIENANIKNITLAEQIPDKLTGRADADMLRTVIRNLLSNAIKFTSAHGRVEMNALVKDSQIQISVKDNGEGMTRGNLDRLFRIDNNYTTRGTEDETGTGLGLILCKEFVEKLGGKIWVDSHAGKGTTFYFTIPYTNEPDERNTTESFVQEEGQANMENKLRILIADDDKASEMFMTAVVKKYGERVITAKNGAEAVEACLNNPDINLVLMDIQMPEMDGYEATRQIRLFNPDVVIIAQTAFVFTENIEKAIKAGCNDYISKPVKREKIIELVEKYCTT